MASIRKCVLFGLIALLATVGAAVAQTAISDRPLDETYWIVLVGGQRIPAVGELELRSPVVWFRALNGVLQSVRLELLDGAATRAANRSASPLAARNVEIASPTMPAQRLPTPAARVGSVGEAAKRAGKTGTFTDLSGSAIVAPVQPATEKRQRGGDSGA